MQGMPGSHAVVRRRDAPESIGLEIARAGLAREADADFVRGLASVPAAV
jgi:hypothetical protein